MDAKLKAAWLPVTLVMLGLVLLIGVIEDRLPPGELRTGLMLGIVLVGFASIFTWAYFHRAGSASPKQASRPHSKSKDFSSTAFTASLDVQTRNGASVRTWLN